MKCSFLISLVLVLPYLAVENSSIDVTSFKNETRCVPLVPMDNKGNTTQRNIDLWKDLATEKKSLAPSAKKLAALPASDRLSSMRKDEIKEAALRQCKEQQGILLDNNKCVTFTEQYMDGRKCVTKHILDESVSFVFSGIDSTLEMQLTICGIIISEVSLGVLLATYCYFKDLQTSYGKCIVMLSVTTMAEQLIQVLAMSFKEAPTCTVIAVAHHWVLLALFFWTASIACDLCYTFSKVRPQQKAAQERRFKNYACFSEILPVIIVLICLVIEFSTDIRYIGYGSHKICFITEFWADIITFVVPVGCVLAFNLVCLCITLFKIKSATNKSRTLFTRDDSNSTKPSLSLTIMAIKLSFVLGLSWLIGYLGSMFNSVALIYLFLVVNSFQGLLIFIAFCCNKRVFNFYKSRFECSIHGVRRTARISLEMQEITL